MISHAYLIGAIGLLAGLSFTTRALPFCFSRFLSKSRFFQAIGKKLPAVIIILLVFHGFGPWHHVPLQMVAIGVTAIVHLWKRSMLLSIIFGTTTYVILCKNLLLL